MATPPTTKKTTPAQKIAKAKAAVVLAQGRLANAIAAAKPKPAAAKKPAAKKPAAKAAAPRKPAAKKATAKKR